MRYMLGDMKLLGRWDLNSVWGHGPQQQGLCSIPGAPPQQGHIMLSFGELNFPRPDLLQVAEVVLPLSQQS